MSARRPDGESVWVWLVAIIAVVVGVVAFLNRPGSAPTSAEDPVEVPSATGEPAFSESASPEPQDEPSEDETEEPEAEPTGIDTGGLKLPDGVVPPSGLGGSGSSQSLPRTTLRIRVFSSKPMYRVSYIIPTSDDQQYGRDDGVGKTWSHTTRVWGRPDYAAVFVQAFWPGVEVTCVITVGGKETERRTIIGPQGAMWCQG